MSPTTWVTCSPTPGGRRKPSPAHAKALAIRKQLAADFPTEPTLRRALAMSHSNLGWLLHSTGRLKEAESALRDALPSRNRLLPDFPNLPEDRLLLAKIYTNLGNVLHDTKRLKEAQAARAEALTIYKQLVSRVPQPPRVREGVSGRCSKARKRPPGALTVQPRK